MADQRKTIALDGVELAYYDLPPMAEVSDEKAILLIHGFASSAHVNWLGTSWTGLLRRMGYRVIAADMRGHGASQKFYSPTQYGPDIFAADMVKLLDALGLSQVDVMGYSMGARITCYLAATYPERVGRAVFGGMGIHIFGQRGGYESVAQALEVDDPATITDAHAASFRRFSDATGSDRLALAACIRLSQVQITRETVTAVQAPTLVAVGSKDDIGGSAHELAALLPKGEGYTIEGLDHMKATGASSFKDTVQGFLTRADAP
ncbi:MAG: alpha/beta hydrolase [Pseudomonadota bacterium]